MVSDVPVYALDHLIARFSIYWTAEPIADAAVAVDLRKGLGVAWQEGAEHKAFGFDHLFVTV